MLKAVEERLDEMAEGALDYSVHAKFITAGDDPDDLRNTVKTLVEKGVPHLQDVHHLSGRDDPGRRYSSDLEVAKEEGALCGFHAESNDIAQFMTQKLLSEGKTDWEYFNQAKPNACEARR